MPNKNTLQAFESATHQDWANVQFLLTDPIAFDNLELFVNIEAVDEYGWKLLDHAYAQQNFAMVQWLKDNGANSSHIDLFIAASYGNWPHVFGLLSNPNLIDLIDIHHTQHYNLLNYALEQDQYRIAELLVRNHRINTSWSLFQAAKNNLWQQVVFLIDNEYSSPNARDLFTEPGFTVLDYAKASGNTGIQTFLLQKGAKYHYQLPPLQPQSLQVVQQIPPLQQLEKPESEKSEARTPDPEQEINRLFLELKEQRCTSADDYTIDATCESGYAHAASYQVRPDYFGIFCPTPTRPLSPALSELLNDPFKDLSLNDVVKVKAVSETAAQNSDDGQQQSQSPQPPPQQTNSVQQHHPSGPSKKTHFYKERRHVKKKLDAKHSNKSQVSGSAPKSTSSVFPSAPQPPQAINTMPLFQRHAEQQRQPQGPDHHQQSGQQQHAHQSSQSTRKYYRAKKHPPKQQAGKNFKP